jgi:ABC-type phosphate transport system auxiliary subunit
LVLQNANCVVGGVNVKGISLNLVESDREIVMHSLEDYYKECTKGKKPIVQLVINRLKENKKPLDGMYLRTIEEALDQFSIKHSFLQQHLQVLKEHIQSLREQFQYSSMARLFQ